MEYAAPIWDPHLQKDINLLESVQRRAAGFIKGDYHTTSSVTHILQDLGLHELKDRRRDLWLALKFNVVHGHVGADATSIGLTPADGLTRAKHKYKFRVLVSNTSSFKFSFAARTISKWNSLPARSVEPLRQTSSVISTPLQPLHRNTAHTPPPPPHDTPRGGLCNIHQDKTSCDNAYWHSFPRIAQTQILFITQHLAAYYIWLPYKLSLELLALTRFHLESRPSSEMPVMDGSTV